MFFFFKQMTAYEMRISNWSSDGCTSDLVKSSDVEPAPPISQSEIGLGAHFHVGKFFLARLLERPQVRTGSAWIIATCAAGGEGAFERSEEHTSELQSLMRISYAVFCLKKKKKTQDRARLLKYYKDQQRRNIQQKECNQSEV